MKDKSTQKQRVIKKLLRDGYITRNECLRVYISRLGALIESLKHEGFEFTAKYDENNDYVYTMVKSPFQIIKRTLSDGRVIETIKK